MNGVLQPRPLIVLGLNVWMGTAAQGGRGGGSRATGRRGGRRLNLVEG